MEIKKLGKPIEQFSKDELANEQHLISIYIDLNI